MIKKEIGSFLKFIKLSPIILFLILSYFLFWKIKNIQNTKELQSVLLNQDLPKLELEYVDCKFTLNIIKILFDAEVGVIDTDKPGISYD